VNTESFPTQMASWSKSLNTPPRYRISDDRRLPLVSARLKVMARLTFRDRGRLPQSDGRHLRCNGRGLRRSIDDCTAVRHILCRPVFGERVALRLLDTKQIQRSPHALRSARHVEVPNTLPAFDQESSANQWRDPRHRSRSAQTKTTYRSIRAISRLQQRSLA